MVSKGHIVKSSKLWCQLYGVFCGGVYAGVIGLLGLLENGPVADDLWLRMFFGFALGVCAKPALDGTAIEQASDAPPRFGKVQWGVALGATWALAMILAFWPLMPLQVVVWSVGGVFFGAYMVKMHKVETIAPSRLVLYDLSKNVYANYHPLWRVALCLGTAVAYLGLIFMVAGNEGKSPYLALGIIVALSNKGAPYAYDHSVLKAFQIVVSIAAITVGYLAT